MFVSTVLFSLTALVGAKEVAKDEVKAAKLYDSGIQHMNNIALKQVRAAILRCLLLALTPIPGIMGKA